MRNKTKEQALIGKATDGVKWDNTGERGEPGSLCGETVTPLH